jgi:hypothetical protein
MQNCVQIKVNFAMHTALKCASKFMADENFICTLMV